MSDLMQAACLPARLPAEEDMEEGSKSRSSGSATQLPCNTTLNAMDLAKLNTQANNYLDVIHGNMTLAKPILDMHLNGSSDDLPVNFVLYMIAS